MIPILTDYKAGVVSHMGEWYYAGLRCAPRRRPRKAAL